MAKSHFTLARHVDTRHISNVHKHLAIGIGVGLVAPLVALGVAIHHARK